MPVSIIQFQHNEKTYALREVKFKDHDWLVSLHNDPDVLKNLTVAKPITFKDHLTWWNKIKKSCTEERFIFMVDNEMVGFTKFYKIDNINKNCVLGADIDKDHRGKGYARFMWTLMLDYCFDTLKLWRVSLTTAEFNTIAQHVYKKLGFLEEGKFTQSLLRDEQYKDEILMYMTQTMYKKQL
jgi:diamine N-acetyltransferase